MAKKYSGRGTTPRRRIPAPMIVGIVTTAVAVLAVVSVLASRNSGTSGGSTDGSVTPTLPTFTHGSVPAAETQAIAVDGESLPPVPDAGDDPAVGMPAPTLTGFNFDGTPVTLDPGADGKATMIVFLAHWCPHCNREVPVLIDWKEQGLVPDSLTVVGITTATRSDYPNYPPSQWIKKMQWPWASFPDSDTADAAQAYGLQGYPTFVVVDKNGFVRFRGSGEKSVAEIDAAVRTALGLT